MKKLEKSSDSKDNSDNTAIGFGGIIFVIILVIVLFKGCS